ncbi:Phosphatidylinositol-4-phosphate 5-kinase [Arthrobotrys conoides]|uniref:Phosphatidylinositol-4-phosphate 5-kinase n=1 Tax=Arthrobotrys conoides TaxID=74498 RepID=A0AAN8N6H7_9PEZI
MAPPEKVLRGTNKKVRKPTTSTYKKVVVLPIMFADTGFSRAKTASLEDEIVSLGDIFQKKFGYEVTDTIKITSDTRAAIDEVEGIVREVEDRDGENLVIIVYSGHGKVLKNNGGLQIHGHDTTLDWSEIQEVLEDVTCDIGQILDCCFAAAAIKSGREARREFLAAAGDSRTARLGPGSYLKMICRGLNHLVGLGRPFSLEELHNDVVAATSYYNRTYRRDRHPDRVRMLQNPPKGSITLKPKSGLEASQLTKAKWGAGPREEELKRDVENETSIDRNRRRHIAEEEERERKRLEDEEKEEERIRKEEEERRIVGKVMNIIAGPAMELFIVGVVENTMQTLILEQESRGRQREHQMQGVPNPQGQAYRATRTPPMRRNRRRSSSNPLV